MNYKIFRNISINQTLFFQIIFVVIVVVGIFLFERFSGRALFSSRNLTENKATLLIDFNNMQRMFEGEATGKMTILDALNASVATGQIKLRYIVDANNDTDVFEINDHIAVKDKRFSFYINERKLDTKDLNRTLIKPGNTITVKLE